MSSLMQQWAKVSSVVLVALVLVLFMVAGLINTKFDGINNQRKRVGYGYATSSGTQEFVWTQPKMTLIKSIDIVCTQEVTLSGSGSVGFRVGTSTGGDDIVSEKNQDILYGGTTVPVGSTYHLILDSETSVANASPTANLNFTLTKRKLYFAIRNSTGPLQNHSGYFNWVIEYVAV